MGVCILNVEVEKGRTTKWLLDGRQRRNALTRMWEDPENIYQWAKKWIGFKTNDQPADVAEKFWAKIDEYLEEDKGENENSENENIASMPDDGDVGIETIDERIGNDEEFIDETENFDISKVGLEFLLEIILLIHNKTTKFSGFTRPFDFTKEIKNLPYQISENGKSVLDSKKLKTFINSYKSFCQDETLEYENKHSFKVFMAQRFDLSEDTRKKVNRIIDENWKKILERIEILEKIRSILSQSKIGLIEIRNILLTDSQKIFNIINSKGTQLNAVEILSAKPSWNQFIKNPSQPQIQATNELYSKIEIKNEGVVKWDLAATLLLRLQNFDTFIKVSSDSSTGTDKQLTLGFKLLSGIYEKGVRKEDIDNLSRNTSINWEVDYEETINELNTFSRLILSFEYFKYFKSWNASITAILSDAIALNFVLVLFEDWKRKGKPVGYDVKTKQLQKNAFILIDQLIYEYVNRQWRGASDAKIASNLSSISMEPDVFTPLPKEKWLNLLEEVFEHNSFDNFKITQSLMTPILYHFYSIKRIQGPTTEFNIEVDHIIPQSLFKTSTIFDWEYIQHNLFNLGLLPKDENTSKGNKRLDQVNQQWLKDQILKYEFIEEKDFTKFSNLSNLHEFKQHRIPIFLDTFSTIRDNILRN